MANQAKGPKISSRRMAKQKTSATRCHNKLPAKKDRHVRKSSHGKFNSVKELMAHHKKVDPKHPCHAVTLSSP